MAAAAAAAAAIGAPLTEKRRAPRVPLLLLLRWILLFGLGTVACAFATPGMVDAVHDVKQHHYYDSKKYNSNYYDHEAYRALDAVFHVVGSVVAIGAALGSSPSGTGSSIDEMDVDTDADMDMDMDMDVEIEIDDVDVRDVFYDADETLVQGQLRDLEFHLEDLEEKMRAFQSKLDEHKHQRRRKE